MNESIVRMGVYTSILSGVLLMCAHIINWASSEGGTVLGSLFVFIAHLLLVFAFFGLYVYQGKRNGVLGFLAMLFGNIGNIIVTAIVFVEIAVASGEKVEKVFTTSVTEPIYTFGPLLFVLGMILLGVAIIRAKVLPAYIGYLLLMGTVVFAAASVSGDIQGTVEVLGSIFTGIGLFIAGVKMNKM